MSSYLLFRIHHNTAAVYQVTRLGHEHCDITEGELLDITPLVVDNKKLVTLYDKDLTEGINLLIGEAFWENFPNYHKIFENIFSFVQSGFWVVGQAVRSSTCQCKIR